jgi:hypothetical protein
VSWADARRALEKATHSVFREPAIYTPPSGGDPVAVEGVLSQAVSVTEDDATGYEAEQMTYEIRKATGVAAADFARLGILQIAEGARFAVQWVTQTDTVITLGLSPVEL